IVHFAQINKRDGFFIAGKEQDDHFSWQKLCGKRVLVDHFFQPLAMFKYALHKQGIDYSSIEVIDAGDVDAIEQAFRNGEADYVHMQGPAPQQLEYEGLGHVVAAVGDVIGDVAFSSLCASPEWLQTDEARAFMQAYREAQRYVLQAPAEDIAAAEREAGFFPSIHPEVLQQTIAAYQALGCWSNDVRISQQSYENLLDVFSFAGAIHERHAYEQAIVQPPE
ncbi:MAG: ABC transporter substrate-binding protein, partial [Gammaproteobacteria bacterium]